MTKGSCLCGKVSFEFDPAGIVESIACFCTNCRKISGSQYGVYLQVKRAGFRWLSGEEVAHAFESTPGNKRAFCSVCGSVVPIVTAYGAVRIPGGAVDDDPGVAPTALLFTGRRASWCALDDVKNSFSDAGPPEFWNAVVRRLHGFG